MQDVRSHKYKSKVFCSIPSCWYVIYCIALLLLLLLLLLYPPTNDPSILIHNYN